MSIHTADCNHDKYHFVVEFTDTEAKVSVFPIVSKREKTEKPLCSYTISIYGLYNRDFSIPYFNLITRIIATSYSEGHTTGCEFSDALWKKVLDKNGIQNISQR